MPNVRNLQVAFKCKATLNMRTTPLTFIQICHPPGPGAQVRDSADGPESGGEPAGPLRVPPDAHGRPHHEGRVVPQRAAALVRLPHPQHQRLRVSGRGVWWSWRFVGLNVHILGDVKRMFLCKYILGAPF